MIRSLNDPKQFVIVSTTYLNADMIQFLCEPLLTISSTLLQYKINNKYILFQYKLFEFSIQIIKYYCILEVYVYVCGCYQKIMYFTKEMMPYILVIVYCEHLYF